MVYETDFYTRRPYSRPTITSYSVTVPRVGISTWKVKPSVRSSVLISELDRIYHRPRPHLGYAPLEDYLNSRPLVDFDDETKLIRAETDKLMRRIYTSVPHPRTSSPFQLVPYNGNYADKKYNPYARNQMMVDDILSMSYYSEPSARTIGRGHLACVSFAGGRGYPRRKHLYSDEYRDIGDEIRTRSYYNNNYNKAYVDAMSLPTGFASYLLRIKPPEKNGTLTNIEKMHIIALSEERKKNSKTLKTEDDIITARTKPEQKSYLRTKTAPILRETDQATITSRTHQVEDEDKPKTRVNAESTIQEVRARHELVEKEIPSENTNTSRVNEKLEPDTELECPKNDKKEKKQKKGSLNRIPSLTESKTSVPEEMILKSDETFPSSEAGRKGKADEGDTPQELPAKEESDETEPINNEYENIVTSTQEAIEVEKELPKEVPPAPEESTLSESNLPQEVELNAEVSPTTETDQVIDETKAEETTDVESQEGPQNELKENDSDIIATMTPVESEVTEIPEGQSAENRSEDGEESLVQASEPEAPENQAETAKQPKETSEENANLSESNQIPSQTDEKETVNISESVPAAEADVPLQESIETIDQQLDESKITTDMIQSTIADTIGDKSEDQSALNEVEIEVSIRHSQSIEMQNVIEEVTDLGTGYTPKESETEPLIEEPSSPDFPPNMSDKQTSSVITEVLSDVPEES